MELVVCLVIKTVLIFGIFVPSVSIFTFINTSRGSLSLLKAFIFSVFVFVVQLFLSSAVNGVAAL